jgi:ABC-2 type transport system permease protein
MRRYHPLRELYLSRLREFGRQPARIFWVYVFPTLMAVCLGLAFRSRPPEQAQADLVQNQAADAILAKWREYQVRTPERGRPLPALKVVSEAEALRRLRLGETPLVVVPLAKPYPESPPRVDYRYDPTRPEAVAARAAVDDALQRAFGRKDPVAFQETLVTEPGARYIDFLIPGLIGLNTMGGGLWGVGFLLVNFRLGKLLKRFVATPMPRRDFLLAILGARLTFLLPDVGALLLLGVLAFGMPIRGSLLLVLLVEVIGGLAFAGIGLLVGSRAQTTETVSGLMNLVMIPMWLFGGVFFKSEYFPAAFQPFIQALPLTQLVNALRAVILQGAGLLDVATNLLILGVWGLGTFALALRIFRWT